MNKEVYFAGKTIFITGGTGSFGHEIVRALLSFATKQVIIYSRDEKKQYDMRNTFPDRRIKFVIGDVRDYEALKGALPENTDIVYHAAALKQVPNCEDFPFEAVKTNVIGAVNVRTVAIEKKVGVCVSISTDKAVKPVNVMGMTKAIQERVFVNARGSGTKFVCVRYGNVIGSRGSVVPFFKDQIMKKEPLKITHPDMTRFWLTLDEAVEMVFIATEVIEDGGILVKKMQACLITELADVLAGKDYPREFIGVRPGEKIHEVLVSEEEMLRTDEGNFCYVIHPWGRNGNVREAREFRSDTAEQISREQIRTMLEKEGWI